MCQVITRVVNYKSAIKKGQRRYNEFPTILKLTDYSIDVTSHCYNDYQIYDN